MRRRRLLFGIAFLLGAVAPRATAQAPHAAAPAAAPLPRLSAHPVVALTFDDLPAAGALPPGDNRTKIATALTAVLTANHLTGTYGFVNAVKLQNDPDAQHALHIWMDAGIKIGNHTWSHQPLVGNPVEAYEREISLGEPALAEYAGASDWHWFRYTYLAEGETLDKRNAIRAWLSAHGYRIAQVTLNFDDYEWNDAYVRCSAKSDAAAIAWLRQSFMESATEYIQVSREEAAIAFQREGRHEIPHVFLLHAMAFTTLMLPDLIEQLRKDGFRFAPLAKVERDPAFALNPDAAFANGNTLPGQFLDARHLRYPPHNPLPEAKLESLCQ